MKKVIFTILLILNFSFIVYGRDLAVVDLQFPSLFLHNSSTEQMPNSSPIALFPYGTEQANLTPLAYNPQYPKSFGGNLGYGLLNIFFGLGSWLAGDWGWGIALTVWQGLGVAGTFVWGWDDITAGTFFDGYWLRWPNAGWGLLYGAGGGLILGLIGLMGDAGELIIIGPLAGALIGFIGGFCAPPEGYEYKSKYMAGAMFSFGFYTVGIILGIVVPFFRYTPPKKTEPTAQPDDLRNWNVGLVPTDDGRLAGQIAFTAHF